MSVFNLLSTQLHLMVSKLDSFPEERDFVKKIQSLLFVLVMDILSKDLDMAASILGRFYLGSGVALNLMKSCLFVDDNNFFF